MTKPIVLYDENHERVGETYPRRAKQLIRSGRATWLDEGQSLIISTPTYPSVQEDESIMSERENLSNDPVVAIAPSPEVEAPSELLLYLAKRNVAEKRSLMWNVIAFIVVLIIVGTTSVTFSPSTVSSTHMPEAMIMERLEAFSDQSFSPFPEFEGFWVMPGNVNAGNRRNMFVPDSAGIFVTELHAHPYVLVASGHHRNSGFWHFAAGVLAVWALWIIARAVKIWRRQWEQRVPRVPKPDPVEAEYRRLQGADISKM